MYSNRLHLNITKSESMPWRRGRQNTRGNHPTETPKQ